MWSTFATFDAVIFNFCIVYTALVSILGKADVIVGQISHQRSHLNLKSFKICQSLAGFLTRQGYLALMMSCDLSRVGVLGWS